MLMRRKAVRMLSMLFLSGESTVCCDLFVSLLQLALLFSHCFSPHFPCLTNNTLKRSFYTYAALAVAFHGVNLFNRHAACVILYGP
jgi:hypothetical protein